MKSSAANVRDQIVDAVRSLASFLVAIKQLDPPKPRAAGTSRILGELPVEERPPVLSRPGGARASFFFEHPDLDPDGDLADKYLDDLAALNASHAAASRGHRSDARRRGRLSSPPAKKMQALVERHYAAVLFRAAAGRRAAAAFPPQLRLPRSIC